MRRPALAVALAALLVSCHATAAAQGTTGASNGAIEPVSREAAIVTPDGIRLRLQLVGDGPEIVLLVHGASGLGFSYMADDFAPVAAAGRTLVFWDQRGNGRSSAPDDTTAYGLAVQVADMEAVRAHMGAERVSIVGHSWGALVAASYAAAHPERVSRLLLLSPIPPAMDSLFTAFRTNVHRRARGRLEMRTALISVDTSLDATARCARIARAVYEHYVADTASFELMRGRWCEADEDALVRLDRTSRLTRRAVGAWDLGPALRSIAAPTLVVHGSADPIPLKAARRWASGIPDARLIVLGGVGHFTWLESPGRTFDLIDAFLRGEWPAGAERPD